MKTDKRETLGNEKFVPVEVKAIDSKNRINLGEKVVKLTSKLARGADAYQVFVGEEGDILLRPVVNIPSKEAWIYRNPEVIKKIRQGLEEAEKGKVKKTKDLDKFFEKL